MGRYKEIWLASVPSFVLDSATAIFPNLGGLLVVKRPNGSIDAPLPSQELPESRLVVVVRDPRDTVSSALDANSTTSWRAKRRKAAYVNVHPEVLVRERSESYVHYVGNSLAAYGSHAGPLAVMRPLL